MSEKAMKTAVVGCGAISDIYLTNMIHKHNNLEVVSCCARHLENARKKAEQYGIRACTYEEILADAAIEMAVILTPAPTHYELIKQALLAEKHVYTEKTMTLTVAEAEELIALADERGLYLGSAPDTFLGAGLQTARKAIDDGLIGEVTGFQIYANRNIDILASIFSFLRMPGGGVGADYGVYYLTALVSLLGPVGQVCALYANPRETRTNVFPQSPEFGKEFTYPNESQISALLQMKSGVTGTFSVNGESMLKDLAVFSIYGTKGVLQLGDANAFGGDVRLTACEPENPFEENVVILEPVSAFSENSRGIGPAEMAAAIREGRRHRTDKRLACHVLDVICRMEESSRQKRFVNVESSCEKPEAFTDWERFVKSEG